MNGTVYQEPPRLPAKGTRELRPVKTNWWLVAAGIVFVVAALWVAWLIFHSNEPAPRPRPVLTGTSSRSLAVSADAKLLAVGGLDGTLHLFSALEGRLLATTRLVTPVMAVSFGPEGTILLLARDDAHLHIFSSDLRSDIEREVRPHPHDLVWSQKLGAAIVISGGADEVHPSLEVFPAEPMGIDKSTVQLYDLRAWSLPRSVAVSSDASRIAIALSTGRRNNLIFYDPQKRRIASALTVEGAPQGIFFSQSEPRLWVASPSTEAITEIAPRTITRILYPKGASTSPPTMIAANEIARRAYTSGSLTFPEVDLDQKKIFRIVELPFRSAAIALSPDGNTAYLSSDDQNRVGIVDLKAMKYLHELTWKSPPR